MYIIISNTTSQAIIKMMHSLYNANLAGLKILTFLRITAHNLTMFLTSQNVTGTDFTRRPSVWMALWRLTAYQVAPPGKVPSDVNI